MDQSINQFLSFTWRVGPNNQYCKVNVEIVGFDINSPAEPQLEKYKDSMDTVWKFVLKQVDSEMNQINSMVEG